MNEDLRRRLDAMHEQTRRSLDRAESALRILAVLLSIEVVLLVVLVGLRLALFLGSGGR